MVIERPDGSCSAGYESPAPSRLASPDQLPAPLLLNNEERETWASFVEGVGVGVGASVGAGVGRTFAGVGVGMTV